MIEWMDGVVVGSVLEFCGAFTVEHALNVNPRVNNQAHSEMKSDHRLMRHQIDVTQTSTQASVYCD